MSMPCWLADLMMGVPDVYVFRKTADATLPTADAGRRRHAQTQLDALEAFWSEWFKSESGEFKAAFQTFATTDAFERQLEQLLRQWLESNGLLGPRLTWPKEKGAPFPGLAPFEAEHAAVFFRPDDPPEEVVKAVLESEVTRVPLWKDKPRTSSASCTQRIFCGPCRWRRAISARSM
jgi:hypothetical protein